MSEGGASPTVHYAIAGTITEWYDWYRTWRQGHPDVEVRYLTRDRARAYLRAGMPRGVLHRIGTWERSPARELAEQLEA